MADATLRIKGEDGAESVDISIVDDGRAMRPADYAREAVNLESALSEALPDDTYMRLLALMAVNASQDIGYVSSPSDTHRSRVRYCAEVGVRVAELVAEFAEHPEEG
jgi:hypothetical protein